jgi:hypothetical protein
MNEAAGINELTRWRAKDGYPAIMAFGRSRSSPEDVACIGVPRAQVAKGNF